MCAKVSFAFCLSKTVPSWCGWWRYKYQ